ncbi:SRPBCC domain-containing protein [Sphingomonas bacterium]|uniref:SRPBCC domain-containing protein n=1 Tax=Sphingomonas bacterium TaxID=1895847 RepID=UPI001576FA8B|nr:SRPBCC domain-containing protein [Sphingomonas bacterium]
MATQFSVPQDPDQVWSVLTDFAGFNRWNSFMTAVSGKLAVGEKLSVTLSPSPGKQTTFKPTLLVVNNGRELRWRGRLLVKGVFDGEHYWTLTRNNRGGTDIRHGEDFSGLLVGVVKPGSFKGGFERMNADMSAELARRF